MTQRQRLLASAGFAEFVFQLRNLFFHAGQGFIHQRDFMLQRSDDVGQLLFFDQRRTGKIVFLFTQRQFCFFLPFGLLGRRLLNAARKLFLFGQRTGRGGTDFNQRVFHFLNHQTHQLLRVFRFFQQRVDVSVHDVGKTRKNTHNSILTVLLSGDALLMS
ncbi:hypothetical protein D3C85_1297150 [compost metagenome]